MEITRVAVPVSRAPMGGTNVYLLGADSIALVDPATRAAELDRLLADRSVDHLLVTHTHPDHVGGVATYADETGATVWARAGHTDRFHATTGVDPDRTFTPGTTIDLDGDRLRILDAPGHTSDHVALEAGAGGPILCGDCAIETGSVAVGAPDGDMRAYLTTLRRLRAIDPPTLCPGHGPLITTPRETLDRLFAHRADREQRVLAAVDDGRETLDEILDAAYDRELAGVEGLARATVRAHLEKLAVEGHVQWDGDWI